MLKSSSLALWEGILKGYSEILFLWFGLYTVKILKIGTPKTMTIIVLQMEQLDFTVQYCVKKMQAE